MRSLIAFVLFLTVRLASVFIVQTFYVPDEYWQSLEVAHKITFGYGYLTWEWIQGIRSYCYPAIIAGIYKALAVLQLDTVEYLVIAPRIFQAILSAIADYRFYVWAGKKKWAIFLMIIPFFWFYTASRTLTNTLETALTTIALSYYPWESESSSYLWFASLCCYIRPTSVTVWLPLILYHLKKTKLPIWKLLLTRILIIGSVVLMCCIAIDAYFYGRIVITPIEFLKHNILHGIGSFYGIHPWHWYFTIGLPAVLGLNTLPFSLAIVETVRYKEMFPIRKCLLAIILFTLIVLSCLPHKEFRFILYLLPICLYICCDTLVRWSRKAPRLLLWIVAIVLLVSNVGPAWYLSMTHQRGPLDTMTHLSKIAQEFKDESNQRASILFLMPCHSTPYYSHIHENVTMRFLKCEPNLQGKQDYIDEADQFYNNPTQWIRSHLPVYPKSALPSHVVLFEPLSEEIADFLTDYDVVHKIYHAEYTTDRTGQNILIYEKHRNEENPNLYNEEHVDAKDNEDPLDDL